MPTGYTRLMEMAHVIICLNKIACTEKNKKIKKISQKHLTTVEVLLRYVRNQKTTDILGGEKPWMTR